MSRDVGALGESHFEAWCHHSGLVPNRVTYDKRGWDYDVSFPSQHLASIPIDLQPPELCCRVQVKSTDQASDYVTVRLVNWRYLVQSPLPAFFLVLEFDQGSSPARGYLVHVGRELVAQVLKRLRKHSDDSREQRLRRTMRLKYSTAHQLDRPTGDAFAQLITECVADPRKYFYTKQDWLNEVGYEDARTRLTFQFAGGASEFESALVDFAIGLRARLPARMTQMTDLRFGIPVDLPVPDQTDRVIEVSELPKLDGVELRLFSKLDSRSVSFRCECYCPALMFPFIAPDRWKLRYVAEGIEMVHDRRTSRFGFTIHGGVFGEPRPLSYLVKLVRAFELFRLAESGHLRVEIDFPKAGLVDLSHDSQAIAVEADSDFLELFEGIEHCYRFFTAASIDLDSKVDANGILNNIEQLRQLSILLSDNPMVTATTAVRRLRDVPVRFGMPVVLGVVLGNQVLILAGAVVGDTVLVETDRNDEFVPLEMDNQRFHVVRLVRIEAENRQVVSACYRSFTRQKPSSKSRMRSQCCRQKCFKG